MNNQLKSKVRLVLVNTSHPGNIGATARVMKNMGLSQLYLVQPKLFPHADATAMAAGADDLLQKAIVTNTLNEALAGCQYVIGTTARTRKIKHKIVEPREAASISHQICQSQSSLDVAFVFGRERTGLTNDEVDQCELLVNIPTNPDFSSLNVASAVQILSYEINLAFRAIQSNDIDQINSDSTASSSHDAAKNIKSESLASHDELELFFEHLQKTLVEIDFFDPDKSPQIIPKLKHLYHRSELEKSEVNMLRGILTATLKAKLNK